MTCSCVLGVSFLAPAAIHFLMVSISAADSGSLPLGMAGFLPSLGQNLFDDHALFGMSGHDAGLFVIALFEQIGVTGHHVAALRLGRLMAALAVLLKDTANVFVVADLAGFLLSDGWRRRRTTRTAPAVRRRGGEIDPNS